MAYSNPQQWIVLIIDDELHNIRVAEHVLKFAGIETHTAETGQKGLYLLDSIKPTIILLDIQMPVMSGYEVLRSIRDNDRFQRAVVIAFTSHAREEDREAAIAAGFDGFITKPIDVSKFISEIAQIAANVDHAN